MSSRLTTSPPITRSDYFIQAYIKVSRVPLRPDHNGNDGINDPVWSLTPDTNFIMDHNVSGYLIHSMTSLFNPVIARGGHIRAAPMSGSVCRKSDYKRDTDPDDLYMSPDLSVPLSRVILSGVPLSGDIRNRKSLVVK